MNPTLRRSLLACSSSAFIGTSIVAFANHAMPWSALLGCFALMGAFMFAGWILLETPRPTMKCLAIWLIPVGLCADLQSMWHSLAGHPQPAFPVATLALALVFLGFGLAISTFVSSRRSTTVSR
jgi:hypothetical protein